MIIVDVLNTFDKIKYGIRRKIPSMATNASIYDGVALRTKPEALAELAKAASNQQKSTWLSKGLHLFHRNKKNPSHWFAMNECKIMPKVAIGAAVLAAAAFAWMASDSWLPKVKDFFGIGVKKAPNGEPHEPVVKKAEESTKSDTLSKPVEKTPEIKPESAAVPKTATYKVKKGDGLWRICDKKLKEIYNGRTPSNLERNTYMEAVISRNNKYWNYDYSGVNIKPGEELILPAKWENDDIEMWTMAMKTTMESRKMIREKLREEEECYQNCMNVII